MPAHERQATHIHEMMEHLGIEPGCGAISRWSLSYTTAFHRCENCADKQNCRDWLAAIATANFAPRFCPNADILFEMQIEQPGVGRWDHPVTPATARPDEI